MAEYEMGPAANAMEQRVIEWLGSALGFAEPVGGLLTSGGSVGNLTALADARQSVADTKFGAMVLQEPCRSQSSFRTRRTTRTIARRESLGSVQAA